MVLFENVQLSISKCFFIAQYDKIVNAMALTSTNLQIQNFFAIFILATVYLKKTYTKQRKRKLVTYFINRNVTTCFYHYHGFIGLELSL